MSDLTIAVFFTRNAGIPAAGLALADIDLYLTAQNRATGVDAVVWDGTQHPTEEIDSVGAYVRIYASADFDTYNYFARGTYTGAAVLDGDDAMGAIVGGPNAWDFAASVTSLVASIWSYVRRTLTSWG